MLNMACKIILVCGLLALVEAGSIVHPPEPRTTVVRNDYQPHSRYSFSYAVADGRTGDNKEHEESRNGDTVQGSYSLIEPDGSRRIVSYAADPVNGFNALVQRNPNWNGATVESNHESPTFSPIRPTSSIPIATTATAAAAAVAVQPQIQWTENSNIGREQTVSNAGRIWNAGVYGIPDPGYRYQSWPNSLYDARAFVTNRYGYGTANVVRFD